MYIPCYIPDIFPIDFLLIIHIQPQLEFRRSHPKSAMGPGRQPLLDVLVFLATVLADPFQAGLQTLEYHTY